MLLGEAVLVLLLALVQLALCAEDFYKVLGVNKQATDKELKSAYRQLSKKYHPDKNPNDSSAHDKFVLVSEAYEALIDPESRRVYDQYGHEGLKQRQQGGPGHQHDPFDLFSRFFGGGGHFGNQPGQRRGHNVEVKIAIALRDFYLGAQTEFSWEKQHICEECEGTGAADRHVDTCDRCGGRGVRVEKRQMGPMIQHVQIQCDHCGGRGRVVRHQCPVCGGNRVVRKPTPVAVKVDRGARPGSSVVFENEADASPDWVAGDLVVTLVEREPQPPQAGEKGEGAGGADNPDRVDGAFFRRKGDDLFWREVLSLREAWLGGWTRNLTHLDGHVVRLSRPAGGAGAGGVVVQPGHVETVRGEGMPRWHEDGDSVYHETEFGDLYVEYVVVLPDQMDRAVQDEFRAVWDRWRADKGVDLRADSGRPEEPAAGRGGGGEHVHEEL